MSMSSGRGQNLICLYLVHFVKIVAMPRKLNWNFVGTDLKLHQVKHHSHPLDLSHGLMVPVKEKISEAGLAVSVSGFFPRQGSLGIGGQVSVSGFSCLGKSVSIF